MTQEKPASRRSRDPKYTWDDTIAAIGKDFAEGEEQVADEVISYTAITRYSEVWEFGNLLYWDAKVAKKAGYRDVVAPWSGIKQTFSYGGWWRPGQPTRFPLDMSTVSWGIFTGKNARALLARNAPEGKPIPMPPTGAGIATDLEIEFFEPLCVGDRLTSKGHKLINVRVRETKIGYGAFTNSQSEIFNQRGQLVARVINGSYSYIPGGKAPQQAGPAGRS